MGSCGCRGLGIRADKVLGLGFRALLRHLGFVFCRASRAPAFGDITLRHLLIIGYLAVGLTSPNATLNPSPAYDPTETEAQAQGKATEGEDRCRPGSGSVNGGFAEL